MAQAEMFQLISPVDGSIYAERPAVFLDDASARIARARAAQKRWAARPIGDRIALVQRGIAALRAMDAEVVPELTWMMGRPIRYGGEIRGVEERSGYMASIAEEALAPIALEESNAFRRMIRREPHGIVLVIAPWNYPYLTAVNTIAPALIAGNAVVLKPAVQTLLVGERFARAFEEAGLPEGVFTNLPVDHPTAEVLIAARSFDFINFTGSVAGGRAIERAAAGTFVGIGLELGGKDPAYVMEDADLDAAVETLVDGAMFNSGQCCCGIERIYVSEKLYGAFVEKSVALTQQYKLGDPLDKDTTLGPMAHKRFASVVRAQVDEAKASGAKSHIDTRAFAADGEGAYCAPQILTSVNHTMRIMREETFGPVVGIMRVRSDAEAVAMMNDSDLGLTASLWTRDPDRAAALGAQIETGTVFMNRCDYLDPGLCWTGTKNSGRGAALSVIGYHNLTRPKSYHLKKASP